MSQAGVINSSGGPLPPEVPTSFKVDSETTFSYVAGAYTSTPDANIEEILGDNGIVTNVHPVDRNVILVRFQRGEVQTVGATTDTAFSFTLNNNTTLTLQLIVSGFADNNDSLGGYSTVTVKNVAGVSTIIDAGDLVVNTDTSLDGSYFIVDTSGADFRVRVTGVAARTINWSVALPGIVST